MKIFKLAFDFFRKGLYSIIISNNSKIAAKLRKRHFGNVCNIDTQVYINNPKNFKSGKNSALYHGTYILNAEGLFSIGNNSHLGAYCFANVAKGKLIIGDDVSIGPGTKIIVYSNHYKKGEKNTKIRLTKDIIIGNNVFIGANSSILPGAIIEDNVVVAANSVVKGILETGFIYGGIPAKRIKEI